VSQGLACSDVTVDSFFTDIIKPVKKSLIASVFAAAFFAISCGGEQASNNTNTSTPPSNTNMGNIDVIRPSAGVNRPNAATPKTGSPANTNSNR